MCQLAGSRPTLGRTALAKRTELEEVLFSFVRFSEPHKIPTPDWINGIGGPPPSPLRQGGSNLGLQLEFCEGCRAEGH